MDNELLAGPERTVNYVGGATIDGAPIAYVVVLSAVCTALAFIPFSVIIALGGSFPLSQAIFPLVGWILGPLAGAVASGIGALVGIFMAPHTAGIPVVRVAGAMVASFVAGSMRREGRRGWWWLPTTVAGAISLALFGGQAMIRNGVSLWAVAAGAFVDWSALLLYALPTRRLVSKWLGSPNLATVAAGLSLGTWIAAGMAHLVQSTIAYFIYNWAQDVWVTLIPVIPVENVMRCVVGAVVGTGVIAGLRAIGLVKPREAAY